MHFFRIETEKHHLISTSYLLRIKSKWLITLMQYKKRKFTPGNILTPMNIVVATTLKANFWSCTHTLHDGSRNDTNCQDSVCQPDTYRQGEVLHVKNARKIDSVIHGLRKKCYSLMRVSTIRLFSYGLTPVHDTPFFTRFETCPRYVFFHTA